MFAQSLKKKFFSGHHFIFLTFLKKMNLKHCIALIVTKKGLLSIDLYLRFRPELICKNLPDMLSCESFCSHFRIKVASRPGHC